MNLLSAFPKKTAKITTANKLQQLIKLIVVKEVKMIAKLRIKWIATSNPESFMNYFV